MPKLTFTNTKGLVHESSSTGQINLSGEGILFGNRNNISTPGATESFTTSQSAENFILSGTDTVITLPEITTDVIGTTYTFLCDQGDNDAYIVKTGNVANTTGDMFIGGLVGTAAAAADGGANANGRFIAAADDDSQISIDLNLSNNTGTKGTNFSCTAVVSGSRNCWLVRGFVSVNTATSNLSAIFSNV